MIPPRGPVLPDRIARLPELASDLWWSWNPQAREVFRRLDYSPWRLTAHNPVHMLRLVSPQRLRDASADPGFLALYDDAIRGLDRACTTPHTWWSRSFPHLTRCPIAYFSAEFAVHQSLPIYAGGLGVLAGDHCKEASDLGLPLIGVGFMYPQGYFHQQISSEGLQVEAYEQLNWDDVPVERATGLGGEPCTIAVPLGTQSIQVTVWRVRLACVNLYLLDTNVEGNDPWDRELSARLYGGDRETRVRQEIVLGVGGVRALRALGREPAIWHLNEGHAAFVSIERIRELLERGESLTAALAAVRATTIFTTHTPVAAGHDAFPFQAVEKYMESSWKQLGLDRSALLKLGQYDTGTGPQFNMTALAMRTAGAINAVSGLHQDVTRKMFEPIWPDLPEGPQSIRAVTNGIHTPTWIAPAMSSLFERHLGPDWREHHDEPAFWNGVLSIPDEELWDVRQVLRTYLIAFIRERARQRWTNARYSPAQVLAGGTLLDPGALTIGYARRFTGYKRPELIFYDPERLSRILNAARYPVQIVFAGKAHPADEIGKHHLHSIYKRALDPAFGGRVAFVDDYDMHVAHFLVQGCDVWLNTPRKPWEASGTSGMKASANGAPHLSTGDGWWAEGYTGKNGWLIDGGAPADDPSVTDAADAADAADAEALYRLLENEVIPTFYERDAAGLPDRWLSIVKESIRTVLPNFSARRMVKCYAGEMYGPMASRVCGQ